MRGCTPVVCIGSWGLRKLVETASNTVSTTLPSLARVVAMKASIIRIFLSLLLSSCEQTSSRPPGSAPITETPTYKRGDGRETINCQGLPVHNACGSESLLAWTWLDCSDEAFAVCVQYTRRICCPEIRASGRPGVHGVWREIDRGEMLRRASNLRGGENFLFLR
jgi:hypothetical protein